MFTLIGMFYGVYVFFIDLVGFLAMFLDLFFELIIKVPGFAL